MKWFRWKKEQLQSNTIYRMRSVCVVSTLSGFDSRDRRRKNAFRPAKHGNDTPQIVHKSAIRTPTAEPPTGSK